MLLLAMVQTVQIPILSALLLSGCTAKIMRIFRVGSMDASLGPTALFPMRLRRPLAMAMCALELGLGIGLIVTAGQIGRGAPATCVRLGTGLLFLVAACSLLELRASRPDVGCGCFGDFSHAPVNWRTLTRSALLALAGLTTIGLGPVEQPHSKGSALALLGLLAAELALIAGLSPELGEALIRLGYSEPCELRVMPADRTLTALRRSKQWRRHAGLVTADVPADVWRELCWRYLVFPARYGDREAEIVFAVFLRQRRPQIHTALVDAATGQPLAWVAAPARTPWPIPRPRVMPLSKNL
jgi:methylamine utilization protein MauE